MSFVRRTTRLLIEPLEARDTPAAVTTLDFEIPAHVAEMGVQVGIYGGVPPAVSTDPVTQYQYLDSSFGYQLVPTTAGTLPLITLTSSSQSYDSTTTVSVPIPDSPGLLSGAVVMFVGANSGIIVNAQAGTVTTGTVSTPTVATNPNDVFGLFELNYAYNGLDVDLSEVDQVGFPYTVSFTPSSSAPYPLTQAGISVDRDVLFQRFQTTFASSVFLESLTLGNGKRLLAPQTLLAEVQPPPPPGAAPNSTAGTLDPTRYYYYVMTEYTDTGETSQSPTIFAGYLNPTTGNLTSITLTVPTTPINPQTKGYKIYRLDTPGNGFGNNTGPYPTTGFGFLTQIPLANAGTPFVDTGSITPTAQAPPPSAYGFDPLSTYFTTALTNFFTHYQTANSFVYDQSPQVAGQTVGTRWTGNVTTAGGYTVLQLTGGPMPSQITAEFNNAVVNIYQPFFSSNVNNASLPAMPTWLANFIGNNGQSPSAMVFGCSGVFATGTVDPDVQSSLSTYPGLDIALNQIENVIVSAFNRGLATSYSFAMGPNQWVAGSSFSPMAFTADPAGQTVSGGTLPGGTTYYYVVTTVDTNGNETVPTREVMVTLTGTQNAAQLQWGALGNTNAVAKYRIYRGTASGGETLVGELTNTGVENSYTDGDPSNTPVASGVTPPYVFYSAGSTSNLYSQFLHHNITTDPTNGISINGLVYGYPFDDQGSFSTNVQFPAGTFPTSVTIAINDFTQAGRFNLQAPATPQSAGTTFQVSVNADAGILLHFSSSDPQAILPADQAFNPSSPDFNAILKTAGPQTVTVQNDQDQVVTVIVQVGAATADQLAFKQQPEFTFANRPFADYVTVQVLDEHGNPAALGGEQVTLSLQSPNGATLSSSTANTNANGLATFPGLKIDQAGHYKLVATHTGSVTIDPGISEVFSVSSVGRLKIAGPKRVTAGTPFQITVTGPDLYYQGSVQFQANKNALIDAGGTLVPLKGYVYAFTADDAGSHTFTVQLGKPYGHLQKIVVRDTLLGSKVHGQRAFRVRRPSAASVFALSSESASWNVAPTCVPTWTAGAGAWTSTHADEATAQDSVPWSGLAPRRSGHWMESDSWVDVLFSGIGPEWDF